MSGWQGAPVSPRWIPLLVSNTRGGGGGSWPGSGGSAPPSVQCACLLRRCPGYKLVTGPVDPLGTGPVSRGCARCTCCGATRVRLVLANVAGRRSGSRGPVLGSASACRTQPRRAVVFGSPEGVVHPKDIVEGTVLWLAGSSRRQVPHHVMAGLVGPACACAHSVACLARHSVHGVSGSQAFRPRRMMVALGAAWVLSGRI